MLGGCSGEDHSKLALSDSVMEENADSALCILKGINRSTISDKDLPYYALLMTQALIKTNVPVDSDSLISIAFLKYKNDLLGDKGLRSNFYMGEICYNQDKPRDAMKYYLSAYEDSKRLNNSYWRAKASERIADIFFIAYNYDEAIKYRKVAIKYYGKAEKTINQRYACIDLANDYTNNLKFEEAISILDSISSISTKDSINDSFFSDYMRRARIDALISLGELKNLDDEDIRILDLNNTERAIIDSSIIKLKMKGLLQEIDDTLHSILSQTNSFEDKTLILFALYENAKSSNDINRITEYVDSLLYFQCLVAEDIIKESVTGAERDFYVNQSENRKKKSDAYLLISILAVLVASVIVFLMWRFNRLRNIAHKSQLEANVESLMTLRAYTDRVSEENYILNKEIKEKSTVLNNLQHAIDTKEIDYNLLEQKAYQQSKFFEEESYKHKKEVSEKIAIMKILFKEKWTTLNALCEEYFEKGSSPKIGSFILRKIELEVRKIGSSEGIRQIEEEVDKYLDGIIGRIKQEIPPLKEKDIELCTLIFAGFSVKAICFILNIQSNTYYVRKNRLIKKISESEAPNKDLFIKKLK